MQYLETMLKRMISIFGNRKKCTLEILIYINMIILREQAILAALYFCEKKREMNAHLKPKFPKLASSIYLENILT